MNNNKKIILSVIVGISLSVLASQCKSPAAQKQAQAGKTDTTDVVDTSANVSAVRPKKGVIQAPLTLVITNLRTATGMVIVGLYGTKNKFPDPNGQLKVYSFKPNAKELTAKITDQNFGTYAMAIYQDVNGNGKIDKNFAGIPTEPYAFSDNYIPRIKAPNFEDCKFEYDAKNNTVTMNMIK